MSPRFSVVIPAYRATRTIDSTIASVVGQTASDLELIVVDDGSGDATPEHVEAWAERDTRVRLIRQQNKGTAGARNTGIRASRGALISFLDNDDLWLPTYLEAMHAAFESKPSAGFAYADAYLYSVLTGRIRNRTSLQFYDEPPADASAEEVLIALTTQNFVMSSTTVPATVLAAVDGFDETIRGSDDWDLWLRIVAKGHGIVRARGVQLVQRDRPDSLSKDEEMMFEADRRILLDLAANPDVSERARAHALSRIDVVETRLARVRAGGVIRGLRRLRALQRTLLDRATPARGWLSEPPADVVNGLPELAANYGRPAREASRAS